MLTLQAKKIVIMCICADLRALLARGVCTIIRFDDADYLANLKALLKMARNCVTYTCFKQKNVNECAEAIVKRVGSARI
jgi:hypothetical protein